METLQISPKILRWAADQRGLSLDELVSLLGTPSKLDEFKAGKLSIAQTETLAKKTHIPFGYFFLETPPANVERSLPDLRQLPNHAPLSNDFFDTFDDIQRKQQWYKEYLQEQGTQALAFVGKYQFSAKLPAGQIAADILNILGLTELKRKQCRDYKAFYNLFSEKVEGIGILVFKNSIVKNNTHRSLSVDEFRGFAIADALVPVIFINGKDSEAAWIFTLAHELAHIWLGESGVSDITEKQSNGYSLEIYCNRIAAELLTPQAEFLVAWEQNPYQFEVLSKIFKVSKLVIARRALDLGKIDWPQYQEISEASKQTKSSNRADPYLTYPIRNSKRLTRIIVSNALNGSIMLRDAAKLLNIKPDTIMQLSKELGLR